MRSYPWLAAVASGALALGAAGCGSNDNKGSSTGSEGASVTLNGAGSTFAAPIYQQVGSDL
jgi:phosphate transport system substrate-binding protein